MQRFHYFHWKIMIEQKRTMKNVQIFLIFAILMSSTNLKEFRPMEARAVIEALHKRAVTQYQTGNNL